MLSLRAYNAYDMIVNSPPSDNEIGNDLGLISDGVGLYDPDNNERLVGLSSIAFDGQPLIEVLENDITEYVTLFTKMSGPSNLSNDALITSFL